ncbi:MAG: precorrin-3B C(17)-methyltransferase [Candidatus Omnitrophota bacterium]|nr:precorrin-3B C(17)-methyltransferase [Candidatus Omnitrophota bacterium]
MRTYCSKKAKVNLSQNKNRQGYRSSGKGSLKIVGIGPGDIGNISQRAREAIEGCQVVVGYKTYVRLLGNLVDNKKVISSGMTEEIKRAEYAIENAKSGKKVCIISSGDPGIYGMAGLVLELLNKTDLKMEPTPRLRRGDAQERNTKAAFISGLKGGVFERRSIKIEIIPGIIAATASAALLGAPLMHDFAVISLSDILTDLELIKQRVKLAAKADFVIVFYNPKSVKRIIPFQRACGILLKHKSPDTPVGIVRNAYRDNQEIAVTTLKNMLSFKKIDMATTIIIGNSKTYIKDKYIITPRGYNIKPTGGNQ